MYQLSNTDKKKIAAHTRAIAKDRTRNRQYDGCVEAWFDKETGEVLYREYDGCSTYFEASEAVEYICSAECMCF